MTEPTCFTVAELMARWKCKARAVYAPIKYERLKAFTVGGQYRVTLAEVKRYEGEEEHHDTGEERALEALKGLRP